MVYEVELNDHFLQPKTMVNEGKTSSPNSDGKVSDEKTCLGPDWIGTEQMNGMLNTLADNVAPISQRRSITSVYEEMKALQLKQAIEKSQLNVNDNNNTNSNNNSIINIEEEKLEDDTEEEEPIEPFPWFAMTGLCVGMLAHSVVFTNPLPYVAFMVVDFGMAESVDSAGYYAGWITGTFMIGKRKYSEH